MEDTRHNPQIVEQWDAPLRPYIKRSPEVIRFYIAVTLLASIIIALFGDLILLLPLWALIFIFYIFTVTPPQIITNRITQFGIETAGASVRWEALSHFYFMDRYGYLMLVIVSHAPYYHHIYLVLPDESYKPRLIKTLGTHLVYQDKPARNLTDRMVDWFARLVPQQETELEASNIKPKTDSKKQMAATP